MNSVSRLLEKPTPDVALHATDAVRSGKVLDYIPKQSKQYRNVSALVNGGALAMIVVGALLGAGASMLPSTGLWFIWAGFIIASGVVILVRDSVIRIVDYLSERRSQPKHLEPSNKAMSTSASYESKVNRRELQEQTPDTDE